MFKMALIVNVKLSICSFLLGVSVVFLPLMSHVNVYFHEFTQKHIFQGIFGYIILTYIFIFLIHSGYAFKVAAGSLGLGLIFGIGLIISFFGSSSCIVFGWYMCLLSFFHFSEYVTTAIINPKVLSLDCFLINHSKEYSIAAVCSWIEFWIECYLFPSLKMIYPLSVIGLIICISGETIRKLAMFTAKTNFNHLIQFQKEEGHVLVTHGMYGIWRHPAYVGWFWWSIGTQITLINPFCLIGYTIASWIFFKERILEEEIILLNFFGEDYYRYQKRVPTGLPFISGFQVNF